MCNLLAGGELVVVPLRSPEVGARPGGAPQEVTVVAEQSAGGNRGARFEEKIFGGGHLLRNPEKNTQKGKIFRKKQRNIC